MDAANIGECVLEDLDNAGLASKANKIIKGMDENVRSVVSTKQLTNRGVLFELNSEEAARWIKPKQHRAMNQTSSHVIIMFTTPGVTNNVLTSGLIVYHKRVYAEKCKK